MDILAFFRMRPAWSDAPLTEYARVALGGIESAWSLSLNPPHFERRWRSRFDRYVNSIVGLKSVSDRMSIDVLRVHMAFVSTTGSSAAPRVVSPRDL